MIRVIRCAAIGAGLMSLAAYGAHREKAESSGPKSYAISVDVGLPYAYHARSLSNAVSLYGLSTQPASGSVVTTVRAITNFASDKTSIGIGAGVMYGELKATGGSYQSGSLRLTQSSTYALIFGRFGYNFANRWTAYAGADSYLPVANEVTLSSPTGTVKSAIDKSFEFATHATTLSLQFAASAKLAVQASLYLPAIWYGSFQGRGFNAATLGVEYGI
jgi:hypothetical protein